MLILVVSLPLRRGIERTGTPALVAHTRMPIQLHLLMIILPLIESLQRKEITIKPSCLIARIAIAARHAGRQLIIEPTAYYIETSASTRIAEGTSLSIDIGTALLLLTRHNVDGTHQGRRTIDTSRRTFEHLDALYFTDVNWEIGHVMASLRIADVDPIEKDGDLIERATAHADVGLSPDGTALADIYANRIL